MFRRKPKVPLSLDWMIVGLGNPGGEYRGTRHNVGFDVVDLIAERLRSKLDKSKHQARFGFCEIRGLAVALVKPLTFMNLSGRAVAPLAREWNLKPERILVVADETDLPLGRLRLRAAGGAGGHNGHKSIIEILGTKDYPRLRLGIGRVDKSETVDHVLSPFAQDERAAAQEMLRAAADACLLIVENGVENAIAIVNRGEPKESDQTETG